MLSALPRVAQRGPAVPAARQQSGWRCWGPATWPSRSLPGAAGTSRPPGSRRSTWSGLLVLLEAAVLGARPAAAGRGPPGRRGPRRDPRPARRHRAVRAARARAGRRRRRARRAAWASRPPSSGRCCSSASPSSCGTSPAPARPAGWWSGWPGASSSAQRLARTDPLTGLANRVAFVDQLDAALRDPASHPVAVALLDLNDFKDINDTHGHDTGDEVLRHTAGAAPPGRPGRAGRPARRRRVRGVRAGVDRRRPLARRRRWRRRSPSRSGSAAGGSRCGRASASWSTSGRPAAARAGDASHLLAHADVAMYEAKGEQGPAGRAGGGAHRGGPRRRHRDHPDPRGGQHPDLAQFRRRSTSRSSTCRPARSWRPRRCCAGRTRSSARSAPGRSSRSPSGWAVSACSATSCIDTALDDIVALDEGLRDADPGGRQRLAPAADRPGAGRTRSSAARRPAGWARSRWPSR